MTAAALAARTTAAVLVVIAITPITEETDETPQCWDCGAEAPEGDEDIARTEHDWEQSAEDGNLRCDICANPDGPAHAYDRAYWG